MMQVKMFVCNSPVEAETEVNQWLAQNPVTVTHITQSQNERGGTFVFVLSVFYTRRAAVMESISDTKARLSLV